MTANGMPAPQPTQGSEWWRQLGTDLASAFARGLSDAAPRLPRRADARQTAQRPPKRSFYPDKHPTHDWTEEREGDGQAECLRCAACTDCDPAKIVNAPCTVPTPPANV